MPLGPYPLHVRGMGWITMWLNDSDCVVIYTKRGDYNMDAYFHKLRSGPPRQDSEDWIQVELRQESYDVATNSFVMHDDFYAKKLSRKRPTQFISNDPVNPWAHYFFVLRFADSVVMKALHDEEKNWALL